MNGAAYLAQHAVSLAAFHTKASLKDSTTTCVTHNKPTAAQSISMLRPSMVAIVNVMKEFDRRCNAEDEMKQSAVDDIDTIRDELLHSLRTEAGRCVEMGLEAILENYNEWRATSSPSSEFVVGTFSRSSTLKLILERSLQLIDGQSTSQVKVVCSQSTPGGEGEHMASDLLNASWISDESFQQQLQQGRINLVVVGADCILPHGIVNKVGTAQLATICKASKVPILCCTDRWKLWEDEFPPPLEEIFELVSRDALDRVLLPPEKR